MCLMYYYCNAYICRVYYVSFTHADDFMNVFICVHVCTMHIQGMYGCICVRTSYVCTHVCTYYIRTYVRMSYICTDVCMRMYIYTYMYVYMCTYTYTCMYT